jgi:hypothetical protein
MALERSSARMTHSFKLSRRIARLRLPAAAAFLVSLVACNTAETLDSDPGVAGDPVEATPAAPSAATSFAGGIPIGTFEQPLSEFGSRYNAAAIIILPSALNSELATIRSRGGKVMLSLAGSQVFYKNADGTFSLSKWKARVDRYRSVNFSAYINDGTIIGHNIIDEPYDAANWSGKPVSGATLEEMAKYSKSLWPNLKTVVRGEPYLIKWNGTYRALDAAWAQYLYRKGNPSDYLNKNVSAAKQMGLGLVVGLNIVRGGNPNGSWMDPNEVVSWGSALLNSDYPCAFISWQYNSSKLNTSAMRDAMSKLRQKAQSRPMRTCSG